MTQQTLRGENGSVGDAPNRSERIARADNRRPTLRARGVHRGRAGARRGLVAAGSMQFAAASTATAHPLDGVLPGDLAGAWFTEPWAMLGLGLVALLYARGVGRVWRSAGRGRGIRVWQFRAFCGGLSAAILALVSPLHAAGSALFAAHMFQHELLILVAAPLFVLGAPFIAFAWAVPARWVGPFVGVFRSPMPGGMWRAASSPLGALAIHGAALWVWHAPALYDAAVRYPLVHYAQHMSFFGSALLLWWVILNRLGGTPWGPGVGALMIFVTMLHSNALGALLTFSPRPLYKTYETTAPAWGFTHLEDQQLGGLLMWVPAGMVYLLATLLLLYAWLSGRPARRDVTTEPGETRPVMVLAPVARGTSRTNSDHREHPGD